MGEGPIIGVEHLDLLRHVCLNDHCSILIWRAQLLLMTKAFVHVFSEPNA